MSKLLLGILVILGALAGSPAARADVVYQFVVTSESATLADLYPGTFAPILTVTDAAHESGALDYSFTGGATKECNSGVPPGSLPCAVTGSGFVSLRNHDVLTGNTNTDVGYVIADVTFQPDGGLSGSLSALAFDEEDYSLSGSGETWTGYVDSDIYAGCGDVGNTHTCTYTGQWEEVPEPSTGLLFTAGLLGLGWVVRRKII
jgi:hypothetical protein